MTIKIKMVVSRRDGSSGWMEQGQPDGFRRIFRFERDGSAEHCSETNFHAEGEGARRYASSFKMNEFECV